MPTCIGCQQVVGDTRMEVIQSMKDTALKVCSVQCYEAIEREAPELVEANRTIDMLDNEGKVIGVQLANQTERGRALPLFAYEPGGSDEMKFEGCSWTTGPDYEPGDIITTKERGRNVRKICIGNNHTGILSTVYPDNAVRRFSWKSFIMAVRHRLARLGNN